MRTTPRRQPRAVAVAVVMIVSGVGGLFLTSSPARADVDSVAGSAYAASVTTSVLGPVVPPIPTGVSGSASEAGPTSYDTGLQTAVPVNVPGVISIGLLEARSQGDGVAGENHLGFATSFARVADVVIGAGSINIGAVTATCVSDGNGSRSDVQLIGATAGGTPLVTSPLANQAPIVIPGVAQIALHERTITNVPGNSTRVVVNAVRITLLPGLPGLPALAEIILGHVECQAVGPNVLVTSSTSSSSTSTSSTSTSSTSSTSTSSTSSTSSTTSTSTTSTSTTSTSTTSTSTTTTTRVAPTTTTTTSPPTGTIATTTTTAPAVATTTTTTKAPTVLSRTGANVQPLVILSTLSIVLGILLLIGSGRPLAANVGGAAAVGGFYSDGTPEKWGPVEIGKTIWAGFAALLIVAARPFRRRRE